MRVLAIAVALAVVVTVGGPPASADSIVVDGDGVAPLARNPLNFGTVCVGSTAVGTVELAVHRSADPETDPARVFADGATVQISNPAPNPHLVAEPAGPSSITLPANWTSLPPGTRSETTLQRQITFTATDVGSFNVAYNFQSQGPSALVGTDRRATGALMVIADVVQCDPNRISDCKVGGWAQYGFRNQGLCIQFVNTGKDSRT